MPFYSFLKKKNEINIIFQVQMVMVLQSLILPTPTLVSIVGNFGSYPYDFALLRSNEIYIGLLNGWIFFNPFYMFVSIESSIFCLFVLVLYVPSTIFQLNRDGSSWVEPVLS